MTKKSDNDRLYWVADFTGKVDFPKLADLNRQTTFSPVFGRIFRTRRGNPYRVFFAIKETQVQVLHIRGAGQRLLDSDEIEN